MTAIFTQIGSFINSKSDGPTLYPARVRNDRFLIWWMVVLILVRLWLVEAHDLVAKYRPGDDYLFVKLARNILNGEWLGPYDHYTLIKGPVYPLFIAFAHQTGIPLLLAQQILYSMLCVLAVVILRPLFRTQWPLVIIFFFLLFNPAIYAYPATSRVFRLGLSMPLTFCVFGLFCSLLIRSRSSIFNLLLWSSLLGVSFSLLWYTREEGVWLLPSLVLFMLYFIIINSGLTWNEFFVRAVCLLWIGVIFTGFKLTLTSLNQHYYGAPVINEFKAPEFQAALGGLMNLEGYGSGRYVPVSRKSQMVAFDASPTFKQLKQNFLDIPPRGGLPPNFYIWTLRGMVAKSGNSNTLPEALDFYAKIGNELQDACNRGELNCLKRKPTIRPVWRFEYFSLVPETFWEILMQAVTFSYFVSDKDEYLKLTSSAKAETVPDYQFVTRERLVPGHKHHIRKLPPYYLKMKQEKVRVLTDITSGYKAVLPSLFIIALFSHLFCIGKSITSRSISFEVIYGLILLGGILSLISVLTYVKITLWPINRPLFSAYPLVLLYISVMISFGYNNIIKRKPSAIDP